MPERTSPSELPDSADLDPEQLGHPRGTLVIVVIFGVLFGLAWLAMYLFLFLARATTHS